MAQNFAKAERRINIFYIKQATPAISNNTAPLTPTHSTAVLRSAPVAVEIRLPNFAVPRATRDHPPSQSPNLNTFQTQVEMPTTQKPAGDNVANVDAHIHLHTCVVCV